MEQKTENKIEELKNDLLANQFTKENIPSRSNSLRIFKTKSADSIYKNESFSSNPSCPPLEHPQEYKLDLTSRHKL